MAQAATAGEGKIGEKPRISATGTKAASYRDSKSGAAFEREANAFSWGGARNSKDRTTDFIAGDRAAGIIAAAHYAVAIGLPLNRHITIHWERAGVTDDKAADATARFLKLTADWLATFGRRIAYVWVRENGETKGSHVHILLHVPVGWSLSRMQRGWLLRITGKRYRKGVIVTRRVGLTANAAKTVPAVYMANLASVVGYVLKGTYPTAAKVLGLERSEACGRTIGKRSATSQNIGQTARGRWSAGAGCDVLQMHLPGAGS